MLVKDFFLMCANGVKVEIEQCIYCAEGDIMSIVFEGEVGRFAKTGYEQEKISYISTRGDSIVLRISKVEEMHFPL